MKHVGDITKLNGAELELVDCICGGSPCQDLSVAGKRAGLAGARSGLFMDQIRLIKEMREHDKELRAGRTDESLRADGFPEYLRPRYTVWENVPGALSSNKGEDFAAVLEETIRVIEPEAPDIDVPAKGWPNAGAFVDPNGRWSVAYKIFDAQFHGVPQRRRRIALVADYGGATAPSVVFECDTRRVSRSEVLPIRESVSGNSEESGEPGERTPDGTEDSSGETGEFCYCIDHVITTGGYPACNQGGTAIVDRGMNWNGEDTSFTLTANNANGAQRMPDKENLSCILSRERDEEHHYMMTTGGYTQVTKDVAPTCMARDYKDPNVIAVGCVHEYLGYAKCGVSGPGQPIAATLAGGA